MSEIRFDDRVAIITGAGGGLGKTHALDFARRVPWHESRRLHAKGGSEGDPESG